MRRSLALIVLFFSLSAWSVPALALDIREVTSTSGVKAWLVEDHTNPILTLSFSFAGGQSSDPVGKEGRARLVSGLLDEGAGERDSTAFQQALSDDSISLRFSARIDRFSGGLTTLTETRDTAVELLRLALTAPRFDPEPVERIRAQVMASLRNDLQRPRTIASRAWWGASFIDHPYGRSGDGTSDSVSSVTADDLREFVNTTFVRQGLVVSAVGDIDAATLSALLDRVFGALPTFGGSTPAPNVTPKAAGQTFVVQDNVPQSVVVFGHAGIARDDADWYAASLLNEIMAGGFGSRLTEEIREKRGLVYGVYAYLLPLDHAPLAGIDHAGHDVEGPDLLSPGLVSVHVEGDAHGEQRLVGGPLPLGEFAVGKASQPAHEQFGTGAGGELLIEQLVVKALGLIGLEVHGGTLGSGR